MSVVHFSYAADGGASRAGRRASQACEAVGITSCFAFVEGKPATDEDVHLVATAAAEGPPAPGTVAADVFEKRVQWEFIPGRRTEVSNTLFSVPYPGIDASGHRLFALADIIHLHWPTWGVTPAAIERWLRDGRHVFWTLHDCWPMTGGCHYPAGCEQYQTACMKCPQLSNDMGLVANIFAEKLWRYGSGGSLTIVTPCEWMAGVARQSAILRHRPVHVVHNPIDLKAFAPLADREAIRHAMGIAPHDLVLLLGSVDLAERRKGVGLLWQAVGGLAESGELAAALPVGGRVHLATFGKSPDLELKPGLLPLNLGTVTEDSVLTDMFAAADAVCMPSLEDNYPNIIVEAFACGTPCIGYATGGIGEMVEDGATGVLVREVGSIAAMQAGLLRFVRDHFRSAAMRKACRRSAERNNDPRKIGAQLKALYEATLGRPLTTVEPAIRRRIMKAFATTPVRSDVGAGRDFLQFPQNLSILDLTHRRAQLEQLKATPRPEVADRLRLLTVRTYHDHHSGRSGPYQFLRHLPSERYAATHMAVPLGDNLAGEQAEFYRRAGALMGAKAFGQQGNAWLAEAEVLMTCASERVDLVHFIDGELGGWLLGGVADHAFHQGRRPVLVATFHQPEQILKGLINAEIVNRFDGVVALCQAQQRFIEGFVDPAKVFLAPHGIDTKFFRPPPADFVRARRDGFSVLLVGHWLRDIESALAAFTAVADELHARLTVISPYFPPMRPDPRITLRSGLTDEALREAYWEADALLLPLIDATANNAILEAMACGVPVISTEVGGVAEFVGDGPAVLCPPGDADSLARALVALARHPAQRARMGTAGRAQAERLDWSVIAGMHDAMYQALLARRLPAAPARPRRRPARTQ